MSSPHKRLKVLLRIIYALLISFSAWQLFQLLYNFRMPHSSHRVKSYQVRVSGNVRNPGMYRAIEGTTQFEILKVAGIRPTSDLSMFQLFNQVGDSTDLQVGTREPVKLDLKTTSAILEFFFGELSVIAKDGRSLPQHSGLTINPGDRVITEDGSQAEISIGNYSRIDLDKFSELVFDKIGVTENEQNVVELFQKAGGIWYKVVYEKSNEVMKIVSQQVSLTIGGSGADFFIDIQQDQTTVSLTDGLVLIEKNDGSESINLISGQTVTIYNDGRPFQITKLSSDFKTNDIFSQLSKEKINYLSKSMPLNVLICGTPSVFYLLNVNYQRSVINAVQVQPQTLIETFAQDIPSLGLAYLYGGPVFVSTFIERILNLKIHKYIVIDKNSLIRISNGIGGLHSTIDDKAAVELNKARGLQKLTGTEIITYLSPSAGYEECRVRQASLIRNLYDDLRKKTFVPTLLLAEQLLTNTESNFLPSDIMDQYNKFINKTSWSFKEHTFPVTIVKRNDIVYYEPDLIKCKLLFNESE
ncbi:MAG TPA: FecR domain-containing protein [Chitinispirillaceae bacterium]|nr:FecR domain-containing protein [Chitinispirillaceae bacterium]